MGPRDIESRIKYDTRLRSPRFGPADKIHLLIATMQPTNAERRGDDGVLSRLATEKSEP